MKKKLLLGIFLLLVSIGVAKTKDEALAESIQDKIETKFQKELSDADVEVEIFDEYLNIEIEYGVDESPEKEKLEEMTRKMLVLLIEEAKDKNIFVMIEEKPLIGEKELIYSEMFMN